MSPGAGPNTIAHALALSLAWDVLYCERILFGTNWQTHHVKNVGRQRMLSARLTLDRANSLSEKDKALTSAGPVRSTDHVNGG